MNFSTQIEKLLEENKTTEAIKLVSTLENLIELQRSQIKAAKATSFNSLKMVPGDWVPLDDANNMISSYQSVIGGDEVASFFVEAELVRAYLEDASITEMQFILAFHDDGNSLVIVGVDNNNNHVYHDVNGEPKVLENVEPCSERGCGKAGTYLG